MKQKDYYYIPGPYDQIGHLVTCHKCGKKILVSIFLAGVNHNLSVSATCAECVDIPEDQRRKHPEIAEQLDQWKVA